MLIEQVNIKLTAMWSSLYDNRQVQAITNRIDKLTPHTKALWGKMTVAQMVAHSQKPLMVALGKHQIKRGLMAMLFGKMVKKNCHHLNHSNTTCPRKKVLL